MAFTTRRHASQLTFTALLGLIATLFSGLAIADGADCIIPVRFSPLTVPQRIVHYAEPLHILGRVEGGGGFEAEFDPSNNTFYQRLTGSLKKPGDILTLVPKSSKSLYAPVCREDEVYVAVYDRRPAPASARWWGWRKEGDEWFLVATSIGKRATFKITTGHGACITINFCYVLQSCPGSSCNYLSPYPEDGVVYIKLGDANSVTQLPITFSEITNGISMPTDA